MVRIRVVYVYLFGTERLVTTLPSLCRISLRYINIQVWACLPCVCHACMRACAVYSASCGFYLEKKNSPLGPKYSSCAILDLVDVGSSPDKRYSMSSKPDNNKRLSEQALEPYRKTIPEQP